MNLPYLARMACLCFAAFFVVHTVLGMLVFLLTAPAIRMAEKWRPETESRFLVILRALPPVGGWLIVLGLCLPSCLWLEQNDAPERVSVIGLLAALGGAILLLQGMWRRFFVLADGSSHLRQRRGDGCETGVLDGRYRVLLVEDETPLIGLAGIVHPRLLVSRSLVRALSAEELDACLRHEEMHRVSHDNLKRLSVLTFPDVLPFVLSFTRLERAWLRSREYTADARAVAGDALRALSLASALVRVARMGATPTIPAFSSQLSAGDYDLQMRVHRLLRPSLPPSPASHSRRNSVLWVMGAFALLAGFVAAMPAMLPHVHRALEVFTN